MDLERLITFLRLPLSTLMVLFLTLACHLPTAANPSGTLSPSSTLSPSGTLFPSGTLHSSGTLSLDNPAALKELALINRLENKPDVAMEFYQKAIEKAAKEYGPNSSYIAELYYELGTIALECSKFSLAEKYLSCSAEINPNLITARLKLTELLKLRGKPSEAHLQAEQVFSKHKQAPEAQQEIIAWLQIHSVASATRQSFLLGKLLESQRNYLLLNQNDSLTALLPSNNYSSPAPLSVHALPGRPRLDFLHAPQEKSISPINQNTLQTKSQITVNQEENHSNTAQSSLIKTKDINGQKTIPVKASSKPPRSKIQSRHTNRQKHKAPKHESNPLQNKIKPGLVPPPPPIPAFPAYPFISQPSNVNSSFQLKTRAKVTAKKSEHKHDDKINSKDENTTIKEKSSAEKSQVEKRGPTEKTSVSPSVNPSPSSESDPDFILDWASVNKKKKSK